MRVRDVASFGPPETYDLTSEGEDPRGHESFTVTVSGLGIIGRVRRWEQDAVKMNLGPSGGTIRKVHEVKWTAYAPLLDELGIPLVVLHSDNNVMHKREDCGFCKKKQPTQRVTTHDSRVEALRTLLHGAKRQAKSGAAT